MSFRYDGSVVILLRINILNKMITETSYLKLTIKPHKLHYKNKLVASTIQQQWINNKAYLELTITSNLYGFAYGFQL